MPKIEGNLYISCRPGTEGHDWDEIPVTQRPSFGVAIWWRCTKCTSLKKYIFSQHTGEVLSRQYYHPKDWAKLPRAEYSGDDIRQMFLKERAKQQRALRRKKVRSKP